MPGTWRELHYLQRPAKNVERKMIAEMLLRLDRVRPLQHWRYVGLGSVYFADFALFHRVVGFPSMVNIEIEDTDENKARFEFNKPFGCVELAWGAVGNVLPRLPWDQPTVLWLDYDGKLNDAKLADVGSVVTNCASPTLLLVSVNVDSSGPNGDVLKEFAENVTPQRVPPGTVDGDVGGWGLAQLAHLVLSAEVGAAVADRNGVVEGTAQHLQWRQLLHFQYADGARMLTWGGMLVAGDDVAAFDGADLDGLFFAKTGADAYKIRIPNVTNREILHMAGQMPCHHDALQHEGIPLRERRDFADAYRYYPSYVAVDL